jgi:hypothetical protein
MKDGRPPFQLRRNTAARMFHRHREGAPVTIHERCARRINLLDGFVANRSSQ